MNGQTRQFFLKVTNPQRGTYAFLAKLGKELSLKVEEYWQKRDDPELRLYSKPVYNSGFNHIVLLHSSQRQYVEFAKYLVKQYIKQIEDLENRLLQTQNV